MCSTTVLCVDPGVTTGYCLLRGLPEENNYSILDSGELRWDANAHNLKELIGKQPYYFDIMVIENFILYTQTAREVANNDKYLVTVRTIGALQALVPHEMIVFQTASRMAGCPDKELRKLGLWHKSRHVRSAAKHGVVYLRSQL